MATYDDEIGADLRSLTKDFDDDVSIEHFGGRFDSGAFRSI
jgi:hypothetical protein